MALKMDEKDDAANDFWTASKAYKLSNPEREPPSLPYTSCEEKPVPTRKRVWGESIVAVASLQKTIQLYKEKGRFRQAADREKEVATILQQEGGDLKGSLEAYESAGDLYASEDASA